MLHAFEENEYNLLIRLKQGDEKAFQKIYSLYSARLYGKLLKLTKAEQVAEDLLQNTFLKIWACRENIDESKSFRAYLFRIAENLAYDFFREAERDLKKREELVIRAMLYEEHPEEIAIKAEKEKKLLEAIEALPPQRKQIFKLCKLQGKSYNEVSLLLQISPSTINDHIVKATRSVQDQLRKNLLVLLLASILFLSGF